MLRLSLKGSVQTLLCSLLILTVGPGCEEENRLNVDVSNVKVEIEVERLDQAWAELTPVSFREKHPQWSAQYPELYQRYVEDVLQLGTLQDTNLFSKIRGFVTDESIHDVHEAIQVVYGDFSGTQTQLEDAWEHYHYYFPQASVPKLMAFNGGFNTPLLLTEEGMGIGLEMFLGSNSVYYEYLQLPKYLRTWMTPDHLVPFMMKGWIGSEYYLESPNPTLLDQMIHEGKILYCLDALLPETPDVHKIFYDEEGYQWAVEHEEYVWAHFVDRELLFSTDPNKNAKYLNDGPFTVDFDKESPSRMGAFIGWQIVKAYMEKQDKIDLQKLMLNTNSQGILNESKYKP